jgi:hypothetical protein
MDQGALSDGERVFYVLLKHLPALPARVFADCGEADVALPRELRAALRDAAAHAAQAAAVARLACASRAASELAKVSMPEPARIARRENHAALRGVVHATHDAQILDRADVQAALVAVCAPQGSAAPADEAAPWRERAAAALAVLAVEVRFRQESRRTLRATLNLAADAPDPPESFRNVFLQLAVRRFIAELVGAEGGAAAATLFSDTEHSDDD